MEDERGCPCAEDQFTCKDGGCVPSDYVCDKSFDCQDKSDEIGCPCSEAEFQCDQQCVPASWVCNGRYDCRDLSDEADCVCSATQLTCNDGSCVSLSSRCDGVVQCPDLSDEAGCDGETEEESGPQFVCCDGNIIPGHEQCDGVTHCPDHSDEFYCQTGGETWEEEVVLVQTCKKHSHLTFQLLPVKWDTLAAPVENVFLWGTGAMVARIAGTAQMRCAAVRNTARGRPSIGAWTTPAWWSAQTPGVTGSSSARTDQTSSPAPRPCVPQASGGASPASVSRPRCNVTEYRSVLTSLTRLSAALTQDREAVSLNSSCVTLASVSSRPWSVMEFTNVGTDQTRPSVRILRGNKMSTWRDKCSV